MAAWTAARNSGTPPGDMKRYDVVVVGAGPAGSTAARFAALGRARTLLIERKSEVGRPVQCGEFLPAAAELRGMFPRVSGPDDLFDGALPFVTTRTRALRIVSPSGRRYDVPFKGLVLDRAGFDRWLAQLAVRAGAELWTGTRVTALRGDIVETGRGDTFDELSVAVLSMSKGGDVRARVVIGADGPKSVVGRDAGLPPLRHLAFGVQYLVRGLACDAEAVEMHFGPVARGGYAWVIPKGEGLANVGVGARPARDRASLRRMVLDPFVRTLEARCARRAEILRFTAGLIPVGGPREVTVRGNVLLAGDAAGHLMPCNGGGIPTAMICGRIAGEVAAAHVRDRIALPEYERRWRRAVGRELARAVTTRRIFDLVTRSPSATEFAMCFAGPGGMRGLFTCRPWYMVGIHGWR